MRLIVTMLALAAVLGLRMVHAAQDAQTGEANQEKAADNIDLPTSPPEGAVILFDGESVSGFQDREGNAIKWPVKDGVLEVSQPAGDIFTRESFEDCFLHVEWNSPPGAAASNQLDGNSGIKLQGRYEIQILNTPGAPHELAKNEAGAIYNLRAAKPNASTGPGTWQTFDIWFTAAKWDGDEKIANARITMYWNGVLVHDDIEVPDKTGASPAEVPGRHPILFQAHSSSADGEVKFRNIWVVRDPADNGMPPPKS